MLFLFSISSATAQTPIKKSPQVVKYLLQANHAGNWLASGDLAQMEAALEPGFQEIALMMGSYHPDEKTNTYLRQRGWGQLVWTQMMYRLLAIRDGVYDKELDFAERVALESVADASLQTVETSFARIQFLLTVKEKMGLDQEIDQFAQMVFASEDPDARYMVLVENFQTRFLQQQVIVKARLASGQHRGIVDPSELPAGTHYAQVYREHQERLANENRLTEIFSRLAELDADEMFRLAEVAQNAPTEQERDDARNEVKLQLLLVENSLDALEHDPAAADLVDYYDRIGYLAFEPNVTYPGDFEEVMSLVHAAKANIVEQTQPEHLRDLYAIADLVR